MSADLILIIIGGVFILLAIITSMNMKFRVPLGMLGVLFVIYGGYSYGAVNLQGQIEQVVVGNKLQVKYPVENIQVVSPLKGDSVDCRTLTMGVYPESHDKDIWIVLKPSNKKYYPQSDHTNTSYKRNGEWQVITRFGGDKGESYEIIVYETDDAASGFFSSTLAKWKENLTFPGLPMEDIPAGATEVDRLTVSLKDNCRGVF